MTSDREMPGGGLGGRFLLKVCVRGCVGGIGCSWLLTRAGQMWTRLVSHPSSPNRGIFFDPLGTVLAIAGVGAGDGGAMRIALKSLMQICHKDIIVALLVTFWSIWLWNLVEVGFCLSYRRLEKGN